jgi:hypothetical protein
MMIRNKITRLKYLSDYRYSLKCKNNTRTILYIIAQISTYISTRRIRSNNNITKTNARLIFVF